MKIKDQKNNKILFICIIIIFSFFVCVIYLYYSVLIENQIGIKDKVKLNEDKIDKIDKKIKDIENNNLDILIDEGKFKSILQKIIEEKIQPIFDKIIEENQKKVLDSLSQQKESKESDNKIENNFEKSFPSDTKFYPIDITSEEWKRFPTFKDIIGMKEEIDKLKDFLDYVENSKADFYNIDKIGKIQAPQGILFYGVPGTGKTFLTWALGKEASKYNVSFYNLKSSEFARGIVGEGPQLVIKLFKDVRFNNKKTNVTSSIIFLDECEETFKDLSNLSSNTSKDLANIVNQFKQELTSKENDPKKPIFLIGATNHFDKIDSAIKSRLDIHIEIEPLNLSERKTYLKFMIKQRRNHYNEEAMNYLLCIINPIIEKLNKEDRVNRKLDQMLGAAILKTARAHKIEVTQEYLKQSFQQTYNIELLNIDEHLDFLFQSNEKSRFLQEEVLEKFKKNKSEIEIEICKCIENSKYSYITLENYSKLLLEKLIIILKQKSSKIQKNLNYEETLDEYKKFYSDLITLQQNELRMVDSESKSQNLKT